MPLHMIKLYRGASSAQELRDRFAAMTGGRADVVAAHVTRMFPTRSAEILDGGSLFWVIKGQACARQTVLGLERFTDVEGTQRCRVVLDPTVVDVEPRPRKPFKGWRYLDHGEAPGDLTEGVACSLAEMPDRMRRELADLGLL